MSRGLSLILGLVITLTIAPPVESRSYQVEVVVFSNENPQVGEGEVWPDLNSLPDFEGSIPLKSQIQINDEGIEENSVDYVKLPYEVRHLNLESKFELSKELKIVLSEGWRQPKPEDNIFDYVYLHSGSVPAFSPDNQLSFRETAILTKSFSDLIVKKLQGVVGIRVSHLLYVDLDLIFSSEEGLVRLSESRKIKLKELNYFDHPLFGVLLMVSPIEDDGSD
ncbi:MAG: CsiV family protein [Pseudomonadota bacterium]|nr:CsiV family protein [Pseudomonadota bacterium]